MGASFQLTFATELDSRNASQLLAKATTFAPELDFWNASQILDNGHSQLMSDDLFVVIMDVLYILMCSFILLGVLTNVVNLLVFWRLGFSVVSNMSLFVLSMVDLLTIFFIAFGATFRNPLYTVLSNIPGHDLNLLVTPAGYCVLALSSWVTAVISMERCCCVMLPMKVKLIFTRRTVVCLFGAMAVYQVCTVFPHYLSIGLAPVTVPETNVTILVFDSIRYDERLGIISLFLSFSFPTFMCYFLVVTGTIFLVVRVRESADFHNSMAVTRPKTAVSTRDRIVARSVIGVCVIYIVCTGPNVIAFLVSVVFPPFHFQDPVYGSLVTTIMMFSTLLQAVSASVNYFVYVRMMTQYRRTLKRLFGITK